MDTQGEATVTITTTDNTAIEEHDNDDDSDVDDVIKSSYEKTEFRLGIVGVVFLIAGALFLIVPGTMSHKTDPDEESPVSANSSGFFITGGVMFGLGAMMIAINVFWCLNEQKILRDIEKAKEKKSQERYQRTPQCAYHSLPQPSTSSHPGSNAINCYDDNTDLETYISRKRELSIVNGGTVDNNIYTTKHPSDTDSLASLRPTMFDNPTYLSDSPM